jgi:hypothetical protein
MRMLLAPGDDVVALVRAAPAESLTVIIPATMDALALAQAKAAIGPLAIERAPATRVNAVVVGSGHRSADLNAALGYLDSAASTTGQVLELS